jgi:predicted dehydrogenase
MKDVQPRIRLGVVGAGRIAQVAHLPATTKARGIELVAVCDASALLADAVAARYGVVACHEVAELLALDLDAVLITVPDRLHLPIGLEAIAAGRHVLVEKPLASTSADAQRLVEAAAAADVRLQTGSMKRHDPGLEYARANVARIGRILSMQSWYRVMAASREGIQRTLFPDQVVDATVRAAEDALKADSDGYRLLTHGAHLFDGLRFLVGDLAWMSCHMATIGGDRTWHGMAGIVDGGGLVSFELSVNVHAEWSEGTDMYGEHGHIRTRSPYVFAKLGSSVEVYVEQERAASVPHFDHTNPFTRQLEAFARAILDDLPTDPSPEDGVAAVRLIEAATASAADDGRRVWL